MLRLLQLFLWVMFIIILQVSILPAYLEESFKPNLIIILVCFLALRGKSTVSGALATYFFGLVHGVFSGFYFGLSGISSLLIYLVLRKISDQLYTESTHLLVCAVFIASIADSLVSLFLITLLSTGTGVYSSILTYMIPQAVVTAAIVAVFSPLYSHLNLRFSS
jgi:rod shape-determining protein MreD